MNGLKRPLDKALYSPMRTQAQAQQAQRTLDLSRRMASTSIRPEKRRGLGRPGSP